MAVSNDLGRPDTEGDFEAMCHQLYGRMWRDFTCVRVGRGGQAQFGVDILGNDGTQPVGVQCKHFNKKAFTLGVVTSDIDEADKAGLKIDLLIFATTAPSNSSVVRDVVELSETRRKQGKFAVSVHFWGDICGHIRMHPEVGRAFIPSFPGGTVLSIKEDTATTLSVVRTRLLTHAADFGSARLDPRSPPDLTARSRICHRVSDATQAPTQGSAALADRHRPVEKSGPHRAREAGRTVA